MARVPKTNAVEEIAPEPAAPLRLRDELATMATAALVAGDHAGHALADSLLQDVVAMRNKLGASAVSGDLADLVSRLKAIL